ncbi:MAG: GldG family protein, partial [Polyangiaceae bacterium]|nr:GldG family protein [Polyangiaceae bacterium]
MRWSPSLKVQSSIAGIAVLAAGFLFTEVNFIGSRRHTRWDFSDSQLFVLSTATHEVMAELAGPSEAILLLPQDDPSALDLKHLLAAYQTIDSELSVRQLDPEQNAADVLGLRRELAEGKSELGRFDIDDVALILRRKDRSWFISRQQLFPEPGGGALSEESERLISEGFAELIERKAQYACFFSGHGERSIDDYSPEGLSALRQRLEKTNLVIRKIVFDSTQKSPDLSNCDLLAVVGPRQPWRPEEVVRLREQLGKGASLLLAVDPSVNAQGQLIDLQVESLAADFGVGFGRGFILEEDKSHRLPQGQGEAFFAHIKTHPITRGLTEELMRSDTRVLVV